VRGYQRNCEQMHLALLHGAPPAEPTRQDVEVHFFRSLEPFIGATVTEDTIGAISDAVIRAAETIPTPCSHKGSTPEAETTPQRRNGPESTP
jgi:hypothetical protein